MSKETIISEIKAREAEKLKNNNKKEDHIKLLEEHPIGTDIDELCHLVAKLFEDEVQFFYKSWICNTTGTGRPLASEVRYKQINLYDFDESRLNEILKTILSNNIVL